MAVAGPAPSVGQRSRRRPQCNHLAELAAAIERAGILHALYWDGDSASLRLHLAALDERVRRGPPPDSLARRSWLRDVCVLEQGRLWHGDHATAGRSITLLLTSGAVDPDSQICARMLAALAAHARGAAHAAQALDDLDSLARAGPPGWEWLQHGNLLIARLYEAQGRLREALVAVRRRGFQLQRFNEYVSSYAHMEGSLALALGDTAAAARAWQIYLGLRESPEPSLLAETIRIRAQLATLGRPVR